MRFKTIVVVLIATLILFTACKPNTIPETQIVIETIPAHLLDIIDVMQVESGVYIFNSELFGTDKDTYMLISHGNKDNKMVDIESMEFAKNNTLEVTLKETTASMPRAYTMVKFIDYVNEITVANLDGNWPQIDTSKLSFTSRGNIVKQKNKELQITVANSTLIMTLSEDLAKKLELTSLNENAEVVVEYKIANNALVATDLQSIKDSGTAEGIFIGYIDSQSIEAKVDGIAKAYRLSQAAKLWLDQNDLKSSDSINFEYYIVGDSAFITKFN